MKLSNSDPLQAASGDRLDTLPLGIQGSDCFEAILLATCALGDRLTDLKRPISTPFPT